MEGTEHTGYQELVDFEFEVLDRSMDIMERLCSVEDDLNMPDTYGTKTQLWNIIKGSVDRLDSLLP